MSKAKFKIIPLILTVILLILAPFSFAENEITAEQQTPTSEETQNEIASEKLRNSDVYLTSDNVTIDYMIDGNLFVIADTVIIDSQIGGDAFIIAKSVKITKNASVFGNIFNISEYLEVNGTVYDIYSISNNTTISGFVYRDIKMISKNINILGTIRRNAFISTNSLNFTKDAILKDNESTTVASVGTIQGNLTYSAPNELNFPEGSVLGEKVYNNLTTNSSIQSYLFAVGTSLVTVILIWLLLIWLAPKFLDKTNLLKSKKILPIIGFGLLTLIIVPIISIILLLINITSVIALLLLGLYFIIMAISAPIFVISINNIICDKLKIKNNIGKLGLLIICAIILWAISLIPYVGNIVNFISIVLGLGLVIYSLIKK